MLCKLTVFSEVGINKSHYFQPLLTAEELERTKGVVTEFGKPGGTGEKLQEILVERAKTHNNWVSQSYAYQKTSIIMTRKYICEVITLSLAVDGLVAERQVFS